jgi:hypothetical protein
MTIQDQVNAVHEVLLDAMNSAVLHNFGDFYASNNLTVARKGRTVYWTDGPRRGSDTHETEREAEVAFVVAIRDAMGVRINEDMITQEELGQA